MTEAYSTRPFHHFSSAERKAFEKDVSTLKKAGVISRKIKVKHADLSTRSDGKSLREIIKKFHAATPSGGGTAKIVSAPATVVTEYKKLDYIVDSKRGKSGKHIMVPAAPGSKVTIDKTGRIHVETSGGLETIHLPIQYHDLEQYIRDVMNNAPEINRMKAANETFGFQLYGFNSKRSFPNIQALFKRLTGYQSFAQISKKPRSRKAEEYIQNLIVVKAPEAQMLKFVGKSERQKQKLLSLGVRTNTGLTKAQKRAKWPDWKKELYRAKRRAEEQKRRDKRKKK